jgi:predicted metal-binding membrane protein
VSSEASAFESLLARDRVWVGLGLAVAVLLCWAWLVPAALDMQGDMRGLAAWMMSSHWDLRYFLLIFGMWAVMMAGMMLPSAAPTLLLYARIVRSDVRLHSPLRRVYIFACGYVLAWWGFSLLATLLQWQLAAAAALTPMMRLHSAMFGAALLLLAGMYQWMPFKQRCLERCHAPAEFIAANWQPGRRGALHLGWRHGLYCLGCCWALMLLLFVGGVMNLTWIVALTLAVLLEKLAPFGAQAGRLSGALLVAAAIAIALSDIAR